MNRTIQILAWGIVGTVITGALTGAAIMLAGNGIATPVSPFSLKSEPLEQPNHAAEPHEDQGHDRGPGASDQVGQPGDDRVGDGAPVSNSGPGSGLTGSVSDEGSGDPVGDHDGDGGGDD